MSLLLFLRQVSASVPLLCTTLLILGVIFVNGWTDAPNAIATCVSTRCMPVRGAVLMAAVCKLRRPPRITILPAPAADPTHKV